MSDQNYIKGITFADTNNPNANNGLKRLESDGNNLFFNGNILDTGSNVFEVISTNIITTDDSTYGNILVTSNLALLPYTGTIDPIESAASGLQYDGTSLYFNGNQLDTSSNAFDPGISCNIIYTSNTQTGSILIDSNLQVGTVMWANTSNITITENLDFNKTNPKINYSSGILDLTSDTGETALSIISGTQSNIYLRSADSDNLSGSDKAQLLMLATGDDTDTGNKHLLGQITSTQQEVLNASGGGGKLVFKTRRPADPANTDDGFDDQVDMMTIFTSKEVEDGNTIAFGGVVDSNVRVCINRGIASGLTFDVGNAAQSYLSVDTNSAADLANVNIGENVRLNFNGPIQMTQTGNNIRIGTSSELPASDEFGCVWIGKNAGSKGTGFESTGSVAIGTDAAGPTLKAGLRSVSIGHLAGESNRGNYEVAIGFGAGKLRDGIVSSRDAISIGRGAGAQYQRQQCIAIGGKAGQLNQGLNGKNALAIGFESGNSDQGERATAVGNFAGRFGQNALSIAIGTSAGASYQGSNCLAIGFRSGLSFQQDYAQAFGTYAGEISQNSYSLALGVEAGQSFQSSNAVAIGYQAGTNNQGSAAFAIGYQAGFTSQGSFATAIGPQSGTRSQNSFSVAIGYQAGARYQAENCTAIGYEAGFENQQPQSFAAGFQAGFENQQSNAIAFGYQSGKTFQGEQATAIGSFSGESNQGESAMAIGFEAGQFSQNSFSLAIGAFAGNLIQFKDSLALGFQAGFKLQNTRCIAIGNYAGATEQNTNSIAIGFEAGKQGQQSQSLAIGNEAGESNQGSLTIAIGNEAGQFGQATKSIAIGNEAGQSTQDTQCLAMGYQAGQNGQNTFSIAIGNEAGQNGQYTQSVAVGYQAGQSNQNSFSIAIGNEAGKVGQNISSIAIGYQAGQSGQYRNCLAIGSQAGQFNQGPYGGGGQAAVNNGGSVAIGVTAGQVSQKHHATAVGFSAGQTSQGYQATAVGFSAGQTNQGVKATAMGYTAGTERQQQQATAVGYRAGSFDQGAASVAIGISSGERDQGLSAVSVGAAAGESNQSNRTVAVGNKAGQLDQGIESVAIGHGSGQSYQNAYAVAIGNQAGQYVQGSNSIAIGNQSGRVRTQQNSIILNASGTEFNTSNINSTFINPIRNGVVGSSVEFLTGLSIVTFIPVINDQLYFISNHGLPVNTAVIYNDNGVTGVTGLVDGVTYYVLAGTLASNMKLSATSGGPALTISGGAAGNKISVTTSVIDNDELAFTSTYALPVNTAVIYNDNGVTGVTGLVDGDTYYVVAGSETNKMQLSATSGGPALTISGGEPGNKITTAGSTSTKVLSYDTLTKEVVYTDTSSIGYSGGTFVDTRGVGTIADGATPTVTGTLIAGHKMLKYESGTDVTGAVWDTAPNIASAVGVDTVDATFEITIVNKDDAAFLWDTLATGLTAGNLAAAAGTTIPVGDATETGSRTYRFVQTGTGPATYDIYLIS